MKTSSGATGRRGHPLLGDRRKFIAALVGRADVVALYQEAVDAVNATLAQFETIKRFALIRSEFSIEGCHRASRSATSRDRLDSRQRSSGPFDYTVQGGDRIAVFPQFTTIDVGPLTRVRPRPLDAVRFVADVHLDKLARHLRLVGLDTAYRADADDAALADLADREGRILLTRDQGLLKRRRVAHGYFIRETHPHRQLVEVLLRLVLNGKSRNASRGLKS